MDVRQDSQTACTGSEDATARLVNLQTGRVLGTLEGEDLQLGFGDALTSHGINWHWSKALPAMWRLSAVKHAGHTDSVEAVRFVNDTSLLATCSLDGTLKVWETSSLTLRATCSHPEVDVQHILS